MIEYDLLDYFVDRGYVIDFMYKKGVYMFELEVHEDTVVYITSDIDRLEKVIQRYSDLL